MVAVPIDIFPPRRACYRFRRRHGNDGSVFTKDLDSHRFKPAVEADRQEGNRLGVEGTPFFFISGHAISGAVGLADFKKLIDTALKETTASRPQ